MISFSLAVLLLTAQDPPDARTRCEIRVYILDKDLRAAPVNGLSAVLVTEERGGCEGIHQLVLVAGPDAAARAPHGGLSSRTVEGTPYSAALCAVGEDGRLLDGPADPERTTVDVDVPYFKVDLPADHACSPDCRATVRVTLGGTVYATRTFPCPAAAIPGVPACCLHHELVARCAELKRHLAAERPGDAEADLDRIDAALDRRVENPRDLQDCQSMVGWVRAALGDGEPARGFEAAKELRTLCTTRFPACESPAGHP